jgi:transposase
VQDPAKPVNRRPYGLIETAKANGIEPGRYLAYLFEVLPAVTSPDQLDALLPQNLDRERLRSS